MNENESGTNPGESICDEILAEIPGDGREFTREQWLATWADSMRRVMRNPQSGWAQNEWRTKRDRALIAELRALRHGKTESHEADEAWAIADRLCAEFLGESDE